MDSKRKLVQHEVLTELYKRYVKVYDDQVNNTKPPTEELITIDEILAVLKHYTEFEIHAALTQLVQNKDAYPANGNPHSNRRFKITDPQGLTNVRSDTYRIEYDDLKSKEEQFSNANKVSQSVIDTNKIQKRYIKLTFFVTAATLFATILQTCNKPQEQNISQEKNLENQYYYQTK